MNGTEDGKHSGSRMVEFIERYVPTERREEASAVLREIIFERQKRTADSVIAIVRKVICGAE